MFLQISIGTVLLMFNITVAAIGAMVIEATIIRLQPWLLRPPHRPRLVILLAGVALGVLGVITVAVWVWAFAFRFLAGFASMEAAVGYALEVFTTLGLGDVSLPPEWRIMAGMAAANGFLNFGFLTALLIETLRQVRIAQWQEGRIRQGDEAPADGPKAE